MCKLDSRALFLLVAVLCHLALAQTSDKKKDDSKPDFSKEGVVIEQSVTRVVFNSDGTSKRQQQTRVRVQSDAGVQQYGLLAFPYQGSVERVEIDYVRVRKSDGAVIATPPDSIQDMTSEVSRAAPFYSDLREKHAAVKGLGPGDILEFAVTWLTEKPLAPGNFWFSYEFMKSTVILDEQLEISVPRERDVKVKSQQVQPAIREEDGRRIFTWKTSHLDSKSKDEEKEERSYEAARGLLPPPAVLISSFRSWDEVGRWYGSLQNDKVQPSPEVRARSEELTKGLPDDDAKLRAIYNYVSLRYRYIGIAFGIGRYQPHSAAEILDNQYGDCKDKHTLLAALLGAAGIRAYPALINSSHAVDADVPSPGQFDHVISVINRGDQLAWMDTTSEVAPLGYLLVPLRDKPALVIMPETVAFQTTSATPPFGLKEEFKIASTLSSDGTLDGHARWELRGDSEFMVRLAFRRVPQAQWKDLVQRISLGSGFAGTVSNVETSSPENTETPFQLTYSYNRKDFADWENHRILAALPPLGLPTVNDEQLGGKTPLWLGSPGEWQQESRIELPKGYSPQLPPPLKLKEDYAEFESSSEMHEGVLVTKRHLVLKSREVSPAQLKGYKAFQKAISDDEFTYIPLTTPTDLASAAATPILRGADFLRKAFSELPNSTNADALQAESSGRESMRAGDLPSAIGEMKHAVDLDPKFTRAWIELGVIYVGTQQKTTSLEVFQKAVAADPKQVLPYKILAFAYADAKDRAQAIATWQKLQTLAPDDRDVAPNLGGLYMAEKRYKEAAALFEAFAKANPYNAYAQMNLGLALLRSDNSTQGLAALHKALEIDSGAEMLNNVAYEMAEAGTSLSEALGYSQRSIKQLEELSQKVDLDNVQKEDLQRPLSISAYWDTLGWIYFKMGDHPKAESYLDAAWQLRQDGLVGDHLGQVYEKEQKLTSALHIYSLALEANPRLEETPGRMRKLAHVPLPRTAMSAGEELSRMRTVKLPKLVNGTASADFYVLIGPGAKVKGTSFIRGAESLRFAGDDLAKAPFKVPFPLDSTAYLLRKGILSCSSYTGCSFVFYPLGVAAAAN